MNFILEALNVKLHWSNFLCSSYFCESFFSPEVQDISKIIQPDFFFMHEFLFIDLRIFFLKIQLSFVQFNY